MIRIIKKGNYEPKFYRVHCGTCSAIFETTHNECDRNYLLDGSLLYFMKCPICGVDVHFSPAIAEVKDGTE